VTRRIWPALLLAFVVLAAVPAAAQADPLVKGLDYLHARQRASGGFGTGSVADPQLTPWAIMAISASKEGPQTSHWNPSGKDPIDYLQGLDLELVSGQAATQVNRASFYAKVILAYVAAGRIDLIGSAGAKGISLVPKLLSFQNTTQGYFSPWGPTSTNTYAAVNTTIWAILGMKAAGETDGSLSSAVTWLVGEQNKDGGWGGQPNAPSDVDDTAAAIMALRAKVSGGAGIPASDPVIQDGLAFLRSQQRAGGGFPSAQTNPSSYAESTAWAIQAIVSCGGNPDTWRKGGGTPVTYLRGLQHASGLFAHRKGAVSNPLMTTTQAMIALAGKPFFFGLGAQLNRPFKPHFDSFSPHGNPTFKTSTVYVKATYADNSGGTGVKAGAVRITVDGSNKTKAATITRSSLALRLTNLANGKHTVIIRVADKAGNAVSATHTFTVRVPVAAPTPAPLPTYHPPASPGNTYPPSGSSATGSSGGSTTPTPGVLTPTPSTTSTTAASGTVTGAPLGTSPAATATSPATPLPSTSASAVAAASADGGDGGSGTAELVGLGLVALLPLGALASYLVHRRQEAALEGAGHGRALLGGGTPWERFKARLFGIPGVMTVKR
jgi:hypothetical protein